MSELKKQIEDTLIGTKRKGIEKVISYMHNDTDFYTAPASSKYHRNHPGGLAEHSWDVYRHMYMLNHLHTVNIDKYLNGDVSFVGDSGKGIFSHDSIAIVGLLHDLCKVNQYIPNVLKTTGKVSGSKPYIVEDDFTIGHGEKSVIILLEQGLELTREEMLGIRWHMNAFDDVSFYKAHTRWNDLSKLCFLADYYVTTFVEKEHDK